MWYISFNNDVIVCRLFVEKLPKHPGWAKAPASDKSRVKKLLKPSFDRALELKNKMKEKYEEEKEEYCRQKETEVINWLIFIDYRTLPLTTMT